jgi:hypothetical protein
VAAGEAEALEASSFDLLGDGVTGKKGEAEAFAGGAFDESVGVYRCWRGAGFGADAAGSGPTIAAVAALTAASGLAVAATRWRPGSSAETMPAIAQVALDDCEPGRTLA